MEILAYEVREDELTELTRNIIDRESIAKMKDSGSFSTVPGASWRTLKRWWRVSRARKSAHWAWTPARETMVSSTPTTGWTSHPAETGSASTSSAMSL